MVESSMSVLYTLMWLSPLEATWGKCVMAITCMRRDISPIISPILSATSPDTPVSTSSNIIVGKFIVFAMIAFIDSIMRDSSPPEAVASTGINSWFLLNATMNFTTSLPEAERGCSLNCTSNTMFFNPNGKQAFRSSSANFFATTFREFVSNSACLLHSNRLAATSAVNSLMCSSELSIDLMRCSNDAWISISSSTERTPCFVSNEYITFSRSLIRSNSPGSQSRLSWSDDRVLAISFSSINALLSRSLQSFADSK